MQSLMLPQLEHSILELLVDNLSRLNETEEADRQGVFDVLGLFSSKKNASMRLTS